MTPLSPGAEAPDFTLRNQNRQEVTLSSFRGRQSTLLVFYPFAFSAICTGELSAVRDDLVTFQNPEVQILTLSVDHPFVLRAWADAHGYEFPLLSDFWPHGEVATRYGVFNSGSGFAQRGTFLVDPHGIVRFAEVNDVGEPRDQDGWRRAVKALASI